jgi:hypothetical protein
MLLERANFLCGISLLGSVDCFSNFLQNGGRSVEGRCFS